MVFWAIVVMSVCVLGLVEYLYSDIEETTALKKDSRARQLAESGIAVGLHPLATRADPVLNQVISPDEKFEVRLRSEGGRLNINTVLRNKEWDVLQNLFTEWGLDEADIGNLITALQAWSYPKVWIGSASGYYGGTILTGSGSNTYTGTTTITAGALQSGNGQPPPPPQPQIVHLFQSVEDMLRIPGMDAVAQAKPDWRDYFTVWSDGPLDMNDAPADLIAAVCGLGMQQAERFVKARLGPDGLPDTQDDVIFTNLDQVRLSLGMSKEQFAEISSLLGVQDSTTRIESTGTFGAYRRKIIVVVRRNVTPPLFFLWQES